MDAPPGEVADELAKALRERGWKVARDGALCSQLGDPIAQRKVWMLASKEKTVPSRWLQESGRLQALPSPTPKVFQPATLHGRKASDGDRQWKRKLWSYHWHDLWRPHWMESMCDGS